MRIFNTRVTSDSGGGDRQHIADNTLTTSDSSTPLELFKLCFDGMKPRFTSYIHNNITDFNEIFPDFLYHTVLVINKWTQPHEEKETVCKINIKRCSSANMRRVGFYQFFIGFDSLMSKS